MKKEAMFIIGTSSLTISLIMGMFLPDLPLFSFLKGMFLAISIAMNLSFLVMYRLEKNGVNKVNSRTKELEGGELGE